MDPSKLPVTGQELQMLRSSLDRKILEHGLDPEVFWTAFCVFRRALDSLPDLGLWRNLCPEFRHVLVPALEQAGVIIPREWLASNTWLLTIEDRESRDYQGPERRKR
jgi:hypothetical protein